MSAISTSGGGAAAQETVSLSSVSSAEAAGPVGPYGSSVEAVPFSSGNPRIEETRGIMHLYREDAASPSNLPVGRKPRVCVLAVPNLMTYADFCRFCGSFIQHMLEIRIVRIDGTEDQYSVIIWFDDQNSSDGFYKHFNGRQFSSLEVDACNVRYTFDVQHTGSIEHAHSSATSSVEQPSCPVCLERLDQDTGGILTTICNHSFHSSCISEWTDSSCPVCRYCQQQPEKSACSICGTSENLSMCIICGFIGCGRYKEGHSIGHWKETQHCYSVELDTRKVWDYVGDNYVHRLILSKTDGKLVELNNPCSNTDFSCGHCECSTDSGFSETLFSSKVDAIVGEFNDLLTSQLENQRKDYESRMLEIKEDTEREISKHVEKAVSIKLQKLQMRLDKCIEDKKFLDEINQNLMKNQEMWKATLLQMEERELNALRLKDEKICSLEEHLKELIGQIETPNEVDEPAAEVLENDGKDSQISAPAPAPARTQTTSSSGININNKRGTRNRRGN